MYVYIMYVYGSPCVCDHLDVAVGDLMSVGFTESSHSPSLVLYGQRTWGEVVSIPRVRMFPTPIIYIPK